jgi:hypothetical protein
MRRYKYYCNSCGKGCNWVLDVCKPLKCIHCGSFLLGRTQHGLGVSEILWRCGNGHTYDPNLFSSCPNCGEKRNNNFNNEKDKDREVMNWYCKTCDGYFDSERYDVRSREMCPHCGSYHIIKLKWDNQEKEKENDMKKVYEYVIHNHEEILAKDTVLAEDEAQARVLIGSRAEVDFTKPEVKVLVRPFC